jgi:hypothetical protein
MRGILRDSGQDRISRRPFLKTILSCADFEVNGFRIQGTEAASKTRAETAHLMREDISARLGDVPNGSELKVIERLLAFAVRKCGRVANGLPARAVSEADVNIP